MTTRPLLSLVGILLMAGPALAAPSADRRLWRLDGPRGFAGGSREGVEVDAGTGALRLGRETRKGVFISPEHATDPFDQAVVSWTAECPEGTAVEIAIRARIGETWHDWMPIARWGGPGRARSLNPPAQGPVSIDIDTLKLAGGAKAGALQLRAVLESPNAGASPLLRSLTAVHYVSKSRLPYKAARSAAWGITIPVPERSQTVESPALREEVCSPTSVSMVLEHLGIRFKTADAAAGVFDAGAKIYGNWPFNTAFAASADRTKVADAWVDRFDSLEALESEIAAGRPVITTLRWKKGELTGAPISASAGHLIVVAGFTKDGDVAVNDPAANPAQNETVRRTYARRDFYRVWLENADGIVYRIQPVTR